VLWLDRQALAGGQSGEEVSQWFWASGSWWLRECNCGNIIGTRRGDFKGAAVKHNRERSKKLAALVVQKDDLLNFWRIIKQQYETDLAAFEASTDPKLKVYSPPKPPEISISSEGDLTTETNDPAIFNDDVIDRDKSIEIKMRYRFGHLDEKDVAVILNEGSTSSRYKNSFSVSGASRAWVDATIAELESVTKSIKPQFAPNSAIRIAVGSIVVLALLLSMMEFVRVAAHLYDPKVTKNLIYLQLVISLPIALVASGLLLEKFWELWPSIEFDFGPEHFKRSKLRRRQVNWLGGAVALPIALSLFTHYVLGI